MATSCTTVCDNEIWILEDDPGIMLLYREILGYEKSVRTLASIHDFKTCFTNPLIPKPALIVADLRLPDGNFFEHFMLNKNIVKMSIPVIIVSALNDLKTMRSCLDYGVVDFLPKPFHNNQLLAKVEWHLTRPQNTRRRLPFYIDAVANKVLSKEGRTVDLTRKETQLLCKIVDCHPNGVDRKLILTSLWGSVRVTPKVVDVHLSHLRAKLSVIGAQIMCVDGIYKIADG